MRENAMMHEISPKVTTTLGAPVASLRPGSSVRTASSRAVVGSRASSVGGTGQFERLIMPHESSLFAPAMALTRSASDAEDLVQETMLRAFDRFDTFRADGSPRAWLHTIMRNLFYNAYRKKSREPRQISLDIIDPSTSSGSGAVATETSTPQQPTATSPERIVLSQMEGDAVLSAVHALPVEYRQVVALADIQGLPYQDIADQLRIPVGTVRSRLSRGRERVRKSLRSWHPAEVLDRGGRRGNMALSV